MVAVLVILCVVFVLAILYLFLIMPRMLHRADVTPFTGIMYAHRGLHDNDSQAPENSMEAFRKAVDAGFGIELDIQLTKDKVPVVFHDYTLKRVCGVDGKVCDYTYDELLQFRLYRSDEQIPRFEDVLKLVAGKVPLIVELKIEYADCGLCPVADEILRNYKGAYCIESFNPLGVLWYRRNHPEIMRGQLSDAFYSNGEMKGLLYFFLENLLLNFLTRPDFVAYNHKNAHKLSRRLCRGLYRNTAVAWTIRSEEELSEAEKKFDLFIFDSFLPAKGSDR